MLPILLGGMLGTLTIAPTIATVSGDTWKTSFATLLFRAHLLSLCVCATVSGGSDREGRTRTLTGTLLWSCPRIPHSCAHIHAPCARILVPHSCPHIHVLTCTGSNGILKRRFEFSQRHCVRRVLPCNRKCASRCSGQYPPRVLTPSWRYIVGLRVTLNQLQKKESLFMNEHVAF